jgi:IS1 family transposase
LVGIEAYYRIDMLKRLWHTQAIMNRLNNVTRAQVLNCLIEGCSIRSTVRMTGVSKKAVSRLLVEAGAVAAEYQDRVMRNLTSRRVQVDELWGFIGCKAKNVTPKIAKRIPGAGDVWLWVAMDADTKVVPCVLLGGRDAGSAHEFITDLASRLKNRVQLTSDGHRPYLEAVETAFGAEIDYAMLVKVYGPDPEGERRYSPPVCLAAIPQPITGSPDPKHISTSFVERQNWTVRTTMRRYTRLSNGFSRKIENHMAAVAINYFALQLHQDSRDVADVAGDGRRGHHAPLRRGRSRQSAR